MSKTFSSSPFNDRSGSSRAYGDRVLAILLWSVAILVSLIIGIIIAVVVVEAWPALRHVGVLRFLTDASWHPTSDRFNLLPMVTGTFLVTGGALALSAVLGLLSAVFCCFYASPTVAGIYSRIVELLAGIPSVVYGFWGLVVLVPIIGRIAQPGASLLAAILVLAMMVLPTVSMVATVSLRAVPQDLILGGHTLGLSKWSIVTRIAFPAAKRGLATGVVLGAGRALGETMAVLMVSGNVVQMPSSLFDPVRTLAANIALEIAYAGDFHRSTLFVSGLALTLMVLATVCVAEAVGPDRRHD